MKTSNVLGIIVIVLVIVGIWYISSNKTPGGADTSGTPATNQNYQATPATGAGESAAAQTVTITYDGNSFSPSMVTVRIGDTVEFVDSSSNPMWVASGKHPVHALYDNTDLPTHCAAGYAGSAPFDACKASTETYKFTFTKAGTWPFHNHVNSSATGKVVVE